MAKQKKHSYSLYLAKDTVVSFDELLTESALEHIENKKAQRVVSDDFGDGAVLYTFPGRSNPPKWESQIKQVFTVPKPLYSQSPCALIVFKTKGRLFALSYSYGHMFINDRKIEADFGLKVAINFVSDEKLKSVERANIGVAIRDFAQSASHKDLQSFGIDDVLDLIRKVSGTSKNKKNDFADHVTGARSLRFTKEKGISEVPATAHEALKLFTSIAYKETQFKVIDFLSPVTDIMLIETLDETLLQSIKNYGDQFEISLPEIVADKVVSYKFLRAGIGSYHPDLSIEQYRDGLGDKLGVLSIDKIKVQQVAAYEEDGNNPFNQWSIYQSLIGSVEVNNKRYALNEGNWYAVGDKIKEAADAKFLELCREPDANLPPLKKKISFENKTKNTFQAESDYNKQVAKSSGYLLLDNRLIKVDDAVGLGVEACDLLDLENRRFIHVKKSSRKSSVLSHFFKQGYNSALLFRTNDSFRGGLVEKIRKHYGDEKADELREAMLEDDWTVEYQIADIPRANGEHNIPFFSKLTLKEEAKNIGAMQLRVKIGFITLSK